MIVLLHDCNYDGGATPCDCFATADVEPGQPICQRPIFPDPVPVCSAVPRDDRVTMRIYEREEWAEGHLTPVQRERAAVTGWPLQYERRWDAYVRRPNKA